MTDTNNATTPATSEAKAPKPKTVIDDMANRSIFNTTDEATAFLQRAQTEYTDFNSYPVVPVGILEDGTFDPEIYTDDMRVTVSVLTQRGEGAGSSTVKAIVIYPQPTLDALLNAGDAATAWLRGIVEKELNHVAVRSLRKAEDAEAMGDALDSIPTTIGEFIASNRESSSGIMETYNTLWQILKKGMGTKYKAFALANLSKKELRKAMESASYAETVYQRLENRQNKAGEKESLFEIAAKFGLALAAKEGLDPAIFQRMLDTRNEKTIDVAEDDEDEFDMDALAAELTKKDEPAAEPTTTGNDSTDTTSQPTADTDGAAS